MIRVVEIGSVPIGMASRKFDFQHLYLIMQTPTIPKMTSLPMS